ncbi:type IIG restriction enzyme/methyltransferase [Aliarcobacter butzleri]|uniref:site-specific DNA-methyltransferase (adenine-specific) n=1 Tax=Aliarcobacter butzleri TaxID=28197 RepID=A0AAW6VJQ0_9BACT|nr:Eco57I restriction-modification methylase domain-containing protein [Aliarcobacter butzleri]MDK2042536.1 Eco57I restriction-modification methylase domain-containing protein [Aliarcobacter butzleri]MDK2096695.1 Eco57I restriction-modification methylase domain-containing protein [Aliarcobacter butzleri]
MLKPNFIKTHNFINIILKKKELSHQKLEYLITQLQVLNNINPEETEENQKTFIRDFLINAFNYNINTSGDIDWAILNESHKVEVIIEVKRIKNELEMVTKENFLKKSFYETILYFMRERNKGNIDLKHIIITNVFNWFIIDATEYERLFWNNKKFKKLFLDWSNKKTLDNKTEFFYNEIAKPFCESINNSRKVSLFETDNELIDFTHFNIKELIFSDSERNFKNVYKILSSDTLMKNFIPNDSNSLNKNFYDELLYILGLEEQKVNGKKRIVRIQKDRQNGSFFENIYSKLYRYNKLSKNEEENFNKVISLIIVWLNRILFLKLFENQLTGFSKNQNLSFLKKEFIKDFDELDKLFFAVLSKKVNHRLDDVKKKYSFIPYLNSSLFEESEEEKKLIFISQLDSTSSIKFYRNTVLKDSNGKRILGESNLLYYLYDFLNSYSFGSLNNINTVEEQHKELISSSVLGLIFEKINGYKDGSFYTPSYITTFMAKNILEKFVIDKFNEIKKWSCKNIDDIFDHIGNSKEDREEANEIINNLKICDPAVGSGHYLVSMLNEIIRLKSELGILSDKNGKKIRDYKILIENDDLAIKTIDNEYFTYQKPKTVTENHLVQETIFLEKQNIIENCLFGVDINPNSVNICRLRLWIELLKHTYYTKDSDFEHLHTLPNIDINIKLGNSLLSKFPLVDNENVPKSLKEKIEQYKNIVKEYKNTNDKLIKQDIKKKIDEMKKEFILDFKNNSKNILNLKKILNGHTTQKEVKKGYIQQFGYEGLTKDIIFKYTIDTSESLFDINSIMTKSQIREAKKIKKEMLNDINKLYKDIQKADNDKLYENSFEWRFEFPEILDDDGKFLGFDAIIGNPPYIREPDNKESFIGLHDAPCYKGKMDLWFLFACKGIDLLKNNGRLSFIATNNWVSNYGASNFRNKLLKTSKIEEYIDFGEYFIFDSADVLTMIFTLNKTDGISDYYCEYSKILDKTIKEDDVKDFLNKLPSEKTQSYKSLMINENFIDSNIVFLDDSITSVLNKIKQKKNFSLDEKKEITNGVQVQQERVNKKSLENLGKNYRLNEGIFNLTTEELEYLDLNQNELEIVKPLFTSNEINRYHTQKENGNWVIYTDSSFKDIEKMNDYPNLKYHLDRFKDVITTDNKPYGIHRARNEYFFKGEKILSLRKCVKRPLFSYVDFDSYVNQAYYVIKSNRINLKYLTALLNSNLIAFWLKYKGKMQGNNFQVDKEPLLNIPILSIENNPFILNEINTIVDKVIFLKANEIADNKNYLIELEERLNKIFYKLYDLNNNEIEIIKELKFEYT